MIRVIKLALALSLFALNFGASRAQAGAINTPYSCYAETYCPAPITPWNPTGLRKIYCAGESNFNNYYLPRYCSAWVAEGVQVSCIGYNAYGYAVPITIPCYSPYY